MNLVLITLMFLAPPLNPKAASIGGVVVIVETNTPVAHATVRLIPVLDDNSFSLRNDRHQEETDKAGRFVFDEVQPGNYHVVVDRTSRFVLISDNPSGSPRGIPVSANSGERVTNLRVEVTPTASISGRIVDRKGKPAEGVSVMALTPSYENGRRVLSSSRRGGGIVAIARTNRRGDYRIEGLVPGQYYVSANGSFGFGGYGINATDWCDFNRVGNTPFFGLAGYPVQSLALGQSGLVNFFPGVRDPAEAMPIDVRSSTEHVDVDFKVEDAPDSRVPSIRGTVIDAATGKRAQDAEVWVTPMDGSLESCLIQADKGSFEAIGNRPGMYVVSANVEAPARLAGRIVLDTTEKLPKSVTIPVAPLFHVRGSIVVEGESTAPSDLDLSRFFVNLQPDPIVSSARLTFAPVSRDGTFDVQSLMEWDYRVSLRSPEPNVYVQSIRLGAVDVLSNGFRLEGQPNAELEIVIRRDAGAVAGATTITAAKSSANPMNVVLVPDPTRRNRQDLYRTAPLNEKGEFEMNGLPPGDYRIFAWERVIDGAWTDPQFLRLYEDQGTVVRISAGETAFATVKPIPLWK
jgi:Carboxypeptidase regulatory-like domain